MARKVLLINPDFPQKAARLNIPLSLLYLGTWLSHKDYEVNIFDAFNHSGNKRFYERLSRELNKGVLAVGLSVMTAQIASAIKISKYVKQFSPFTPIIWGGVHPTLYPEQVATVDYVDFAVKGEGEITAVELLEAIEFENNGFPPLLHRIKGIVFKDVCGGVVATAPREPMDINELHCPDLNLVEDVRLIGDMAEVTKRVMVGLPLLASRGCPHRCAFCSNPTLGIKYRFRQADAVLNDIVELLGQGVNHICFMDDDFFANKKRLVEVLDGVERQNLEFKWVAYARISDLSMRHMTKELLDKIKRSGCQQLFLGVESGSQRVLDMIKKGILVEDSFDAARRLNEVGIDAVLSYITGFPGESADEIEQTIDLSVKIAGINDTFRTMGPFIYHPYAGSELYVKCLELGLEEPTSLEGWIGIPDIGDGARGAREYPEFAWVQYPMKELVKLNFYCWMAGIRIKWRWLSRFARRIGAWRCRGRHLGFPLEIWLIKLFRKFGIDKLVSIGKFG